MLNGKYSAIWQRAAHTTYQLSSPSCSTGVISRGLTSNKNLKTLHKYKWQIPVPHGSKLHIPPTNYHLLGAQQEPYKKPIFYQKMIAEDDQF